MHTNKQLVKSHHTKKRHYRIPLCNSFRHTVPTSIDPLIIDVERILLFHTIAIFGVNDIVVGFMDEKVVEHNTGHDPVHDPSHIIRCDDYVTETAKTLPTHLEDTDCVFCNNAGAGSAAVEPQSVLREQSVGRLLEDGNDSTCRRVCAVGKDVLLAGEILVGAIGKASHTKDSLVMRRTWDAGEDVGDSAIMLAHDSGSEGVIAFAIKVVLAVGDRFTVEREQGAVHEANAMRQTVMLLHMALDSVSLLLVGPVDDIVPEGK